MIALLLGLACAERLGPVPPPEPLGLQAHLETQRVPSGQPVRVTVVWTTPDGWTFHPIPPELAAAGTASLADLVGTELTIAVEGLTATREDASSAERGDDLVSTETWSLSGPDGSYVLPPLGGVFVGPEGQAELRSTGRLFFDVGVAGPSSDVPDLAMPAMPETPVVWPWALGAAAAAALGLGAWWFWPRPPAPVATPETPQDEVLRVWAELRARETDAHALALGLSAAFRRYLDRALSVPAPRQTTRETLRELQVPEGLRERCRRLLTATDLVKFARRGGGPELFVELDSDLRAFVEGTRPTPAPDAEVAGE